MIETKGGSAKGEQGQPNMMGGISQVDERSTFVLYSARICIFNKNKQTLIADKLP